jgi:ABC-type enterochelin transport system permease subunit
VFGTVLGAEEHCWLPKPVHNPQGGADMDKVKTAIGQIVDIGLALIAVAIVATVLFGSNLPFFGGVVGNLVGMVDSLGKSGLVGLIALGVILWLFAKRSPG